MERFYYPSDLPLLHFFVCFLLCPFLSLLSPSQRVSCCLAAIETESNWNVLKQNRIRVKPPQKIMSTLAELCSDLLLDPLPPARKRNPAIPHAPVRNHRLNPTEQKVFFSFIYSDYSFIFPWFICIVW